MTIKYLFLLGFALLCGYCLAQQNYISYYQSINEAEEQFVLTRDKACLKTYQKAFAKHKPFLKDVYIASQIALFVGDTTQFLNFLKTCFSNGMPLAAVNASSFIRKANIGSLANKIEHLHKKYFKNPKINEILNNKICLSCYQSDSFKLKNGGRSLEFYEIENAFRQFILDSLLQKGKFANEQLLGISTDESKTRFYTKNNRPDPYQALALGATLTTPEEMELRLKCPYNIILHSRCFFREHRELFYQAMLNGYLHPKEFGILEETAILWHQSDKNPADTCAAATVKISYNIFGFNPMRNSQIFSNTELGLQEVEANRKNIYMQKYAIDVQKKALEKQYGFIFFFDFVDRQ